MANSAAPLSLLHGESGAAGFTEQLQRATTQVETEPATDAPAHVTPVAPLPQFKPGLLQKSLPDSAGLWNPADIRMLQSVRVAGTNTLDSLRVTSTTISHSGSSASPNTLQPGNVIIPGVSLSGNAISLSGSQSGKVTSPGVDKSDIPGRPGPELGASAARLKVRGNHSQKSAENQIDEKTGPTDTPLLNLATERGPSICLPAPVSASISPNSGHSENVAVSTSPQIDTPVASAAQVQLAPSAATVVNGIFKTSFSQTFGSLAFAARIKPSVAAVPQNSNSDPAVKKTPDPEPSSITGIASSFTFVNDEEPGQDSRRAAVSPAEPVQMRATSKKGDATAATIEPLDPRSATMGVPAFHVVRLPAPDEPGTTARAEAPSSTPASSEPTCALPDNDTAAPSSARNITVRLHSASGETVDVRIAARPSNLDVAVRTGNDATAQNLRQGLGNLETRLAQSGFHAEAWHPTLGGSTAEPATTPDKRSSDSPSQQDSQPGSGGSQQHGADSGNHPSRRPRWVNQLTSTLNSQSTGKGNANGIGN